MKVTFYNHIWNNERRKKNWALKKSSGQSPNVSSEKKVERKLDIQTGQGLIMTQKERLRKRDRDKKGKREREQIQ